MGAPAKQGPGSVSGSCAAEAEAFASLAADLKSLFAAGVEQPLPEARFRELALRVYRYQLATNGPYRAFAEGRGAGVDAVERWEEIPPVPTSAFKALPLVSGDPHAVDAVFRTSGTTGGAARRGEHHVLDLGLYRASLLPNFRAHLLPDGARLRVLSLIPSPERVPDSSLSHMMGVVVDELAAPGSRWLLDPEGGIDEEALGQALREAEHDGEPVLVAGTAFALVHALDALERRGWSFGLPGGSRIMETGGFKGRSRAVPRDELYASLTGALGVPADRIVNEYGMTELLSQFYEPVLRGGGGAARPGGDEARAAEAEHGSTPTGGAPVASRHHAPPPWVRTRVLDPSTLEPLPPGGTGLLCHVDLANAGSVCAVLTEDLGVELPEGFRVLGRVEGSEPRGCSLAMDELLRATEGRR